MARSILQRRLVDVSERLKRLRVELLGVKRSQEYNPAPLREGK